MGFPDWQEQASLAQLIAGALADAGIPVLGNPVPLFTVPQPAAPGAGIGFGSNNAAFAGMVTDGVVGMTSAIFYDTPSAGPNGIPAAWPGNGGPIAPGVTVPVCNFSPDIPTTLAGTNDAALAAFLGGAPNGAIIMPYHECNLVSNKLNPSDIQALDAYLLPKVQAINPTLVYGRGLSASAVNQGNDPTPYLIPGLPLYGMDGYQASNASRTPATLFDATRLAIQAVQPGANIAIIETGTALDVGTWFNAIAGYAIANGLVRVQGYFAAGGTQSQPFKASMVPAINNVITQLSGAATTLTLNAGQTKPLPPLHGSPNANWAAANGQSYDLVWVLIAGAGSTLPFAVCTLNWFNQDNPAAIAAHSQRWILPAGVSTSAGAIIAGSGPQHGAYLQAKITNKDTVPMQVQCFVNSASRVAARHDWRWDAVTSPSVPTYTNAGGAASSLSLGEVDSVNIASGNSKAWLMSLYAGQAYLRVVVNGAAGIKTVHVTAAPQPPSIWGSVNTQSQYLPLSAANGDNDQAWVMALPRGPVQVTITNNDANTVGVALEMVAIET